MRLRSSVIAHMGRMEALQLGEFQTVAASRRLLAVDVPLLRHFSYCGLPNYTWVFDVPAEWATRLEHLDRGPPFIWPTDCVFRSPRTLYGRIPEGGSFGRSILYSVQEAFRLFAHTIRGSWQLHATSDAVKLRLGRHRYKLHCAAVSDWLPHVPGAAACWGHLRELHLRLPDFLRFLAALSQGIALRALAISHGIALPALAVAGFVTKRSAQLESAAALRTATSLLDTPRLQSLRLTLGAEFDSASAVTGSWRVMPAFRVGAARRAHSRHPNPCRIRRLGETLSGTVPPCEASGD
ncbi:hypothetical protein AURDEDRAFT_130880 [Auricularia subglabra TFB-10046 SS5]|nr:hypothetical protein AURDEDRAFT_130880 [Auricularia subglabra TFB-10046 SS5]